MNIANLVNTVICGDCKDVMAQFPDDCIDLIIIDPPYNISKLNDNRDRSKMNAPIFRRESPLRYDFGKWDNLERQDFLGFTQKWLFERECSRFGYCLYF